MKRKPPAKRQHTATEGPYDRFAVWRPEPRPAYHMPSPWRISRVNVTGWASTESTGLPHPMYVGNKRAFATKEEAMRLLAVFALRGDAVQGEP